MSNEINILNYIYENENVTQRDIAKHVGMSVGGVNLLLKKMISAGLIRIEALKNPKLVKYILTPEGLHEKMQKTYRFIIRNYRQILKARQVIMNIFKEIEGDTSNIMKPNHVSGRYSKVFLYGEKDELFDIIRMIIEEELGGFGDRYEYIGSVERLETLYSMQDEDDHSNKSAVVIIWHPECNQRFVDRNLPFINILDNLEVE